MKEDDIVNIKGSNGYWKGRIVKIDHEYEYKFKNGEVFRFNYSNPIARVVGDDGISHAYVIEHDLEFKDGQYYEVRQ